VKKGRSPRSLKQGEAVNLVKSGVDPGKISAKVGEERLIT